MGNTIETKESPFYDISFLNVGNIGVRLDVKVGKLKPVGIKVQLFKEGQLAFENITGEGGIVYFAKVEEGEYQIKIATNPNNLLNSENKLELFEGSKEKPYEEQLFDNLGSIEVKNQTFIQNYKLRLKLETSFFIDVGDEFNSFITGESKELKGRFLTFLTRKKDGVNSENEIKEFLVRSEYSKEKNLKLINQKSEIIDFLNDYPVCYLSIEEDEFDYYDDMNKAKKGGISMGAGIVINFIASRVAVPLMILGNGLALIKGKEVYDTLDDSRDIAEAIIMDLLDNEDFQSLKLKRPNEFHPSNYMLLNRKTKDSDIDNIIIGISKDINYQRNKYNFEYIDYVTKVDEIFSDKGKEEIIEKFGIEEESITGKKLYKFDNMYFELLPQNQSVYHQGDYQNFGEVDKLYNGKYNRKFVSLPYGRHEAVLTHRDRLVTNKNYYGTYNFYGPSNAIGHFVYDMIPYWLWGTFEGDEKTLAERLHGVVHEYAKDKGEIYSMEDFTTLDTCVKLALQVIFGFASNISNEIIKKVEDVPKNIGNKYENMKYEFKSSGQKMIDNMIYKRYRKW